MVTNRYFITHFPQIMALEAPAPADFYPNLTAYFRCVARRECSWIGQDEAICADILHQYVFRVTTSHSFEGIESRLRGAGRTFPTPHAYANFLYVVFKNAIREYLRDRLRRRRAVEVDVEQCPDLPASEIPEPEETLTALAGELHDALSEHERLLLGWRYNQQMTLEDIAQRLGIGKSSVDRHLKRLERERLPMLLGGEMDPEEVRSLLGILLLRLERETPEPRTSRPDTPGVMGNMPGVKRQSLREITPIERSRRIAA